MTVLDHMGDSSWFFCFPLSWAVFFIAMLGIIHPAFWVAVMDIYRSELFIFMYVLVGLWSLLSLALMCGIIAEISCLYVFWIWFTLIFATTMTCMMIILVSGFCVMGRRRRAIFAIFGLIYYLMTFYFVVVVNKQRKEVFNVCSGCTTNATTLSNTPTTKTLKRGKWLRTAASTAMAALLAAADGADQTTRNWVVYPFRDLDAAEPKTLRTKDEDRVARLAELLINSDECRTPHKPAHGHYEVHRHQGTALQLTLRCDSGYTENSVSTECKNNWWDRPLPQCRKRRQADPLPLPSGGCLMPDYPENGLYTVADHESAEPGDFVQGNNVILMVTCNEPYRAVDPYVVCVEGRWRHAPPSCQKHCKLLFDPTVEYRCLKAFKDTFLACDMWQPDGVTVAASCRPGHAHRGPFRYLRCRGDAWDHAVSCVPNANFTR